MDEDQSEIELSPSEVRTISLACDNALNEYELEPGNSTIYIDVTVYPAGNTNPRSAKTFRSDILTIGDTIGPASLLSTTEGLSFAQSGFNLNFSVSNNGSSDLNLRLEFATSEEIYTVINGANSTAHSFTLGKFETTSFPEMLLQINTTEEATLGETYLVLVSLFDENNYLNPIIVKLLLTYQL